jgi:hypothetical protein
MVRWVQNKCEAGASVPFKSCSSLEIDAISYCYNRCYFSDACHTFGQCRDGFLSRGEGVYGFDYSVRRLRGPATAFSLAGLQGFGVTHISVLKLSKQHTLCGRLCISVVFRTCTFKELCNNHLRTQEDALITIGWQDISRRDT